MCTLKLEKHWSDKAFNNHESLLESRGGLSEVMSKCTTTDCDLFEVGQRHQDFLQTPDSVPTYG